jgi:hypothetical protein
MSSRTTWFWILTAAALFAFIYFIPAPAPKSPVPVLPSFQAASVSSIQILPKGHQLEIRAERTNVSWHLTRPISYPAQSAAITNLLFALQNLVPDTAIPETELTNRFNADEEFGFTDPQFTLTFQPELSLRVGKLTPPGDQVYLQVVGDVNGIIYVVDSELLKLIPNSANEWRDRTLVNFQDLAFDRIAITNGSQALVLQRESTNSPFAMIYPISSRADNSKLQTALEQLRDLRIAQFISDDPKTETESLGLRPPGFELSFAQGTNLVTWLQFGKSPTNDSNQIFGRRVNLNSIVTVPNEPLAPWRFGNVNEFRDPYLVSLSSNLDSIEICGDEHFCLQRQPDDHWRVLPEDFEADTTVVDDFLTRLVGLKIIEFVKDLVPEKALPNYGLASPSRQYFLKFSSGTSSSEASVPSDTDSTPSANASAASETVADPISTNPPVVLSFGSTNSDDHVFVRRSDETSVYAVRADDLSPLPSTSSHFRERRLWHFNADDLASVVIRQDGQERELVRNGAYQWSLGSHAQGTLEPLAIEETVRDFIKTSVGAWLPPGQNAREYCDLTNHCRQFTFILKNGNSASLKLGGQAPSGLPFGAVTREDGQIWLFEFTNSRASASLCRDIMNFLSP